MARVAVSEQDVQALIEHVYPNKRNLRRIDLALKLLEKGPGCENSLVRGTLYGLVNAITDMEDHYWFMSPNTAGAKKPNREARLKSVMLGEAARHKQRALQWAFERAGLGS